MEINITAENYDDIVLHSDRPVLIDFWASWCPPCMLLSPVIAAIAEERSDLVVCKVNADAHPDICMEFQVQSIPALFIIKDGKVIDRSVGYRDKNAILDWIDSII